MQEAIDKELYTYLSEIIDLLCEEKLFSINNIDSFMDWVNGPVRSALVVMN